MNSNFADRLLLVRSPSGGINTGDCLNGFGDFSETLVEVNPNLTSGAYPEDWTEYSYLIDATGRVAFVYFVEDAANNGNYVGIDNVNWIAGLPEAELQLESSYSPTENLNIGNTVTVTHTLTNNGPRDANMAEVSISLPTTLTYVSNTCGATASGSTLNWSVGTLSNGSNMQCQVTLEIAEFGQHLYQASASASETDSVTNNNSNRFYINGPAAIIPTLGFYGLALLVLGTLLIARRFKFV